MYVIYQNKINKRLVCLTEHKKVAEYICSKFNNTHYQKLPLLANGLGQDIKIFTNLLDEKEKENATKES